VELLVVGFRLYVLGSGFRIFGFYRACFDRWGGHRAEDPLGEAHHHTPGKRNWLGLRGSGLKV
jgi:hypothetical protein